MIDIILLGLNHKTAPVELRESLAFSKDETIAALEVIQKDPSVREVILFSTCNRVEILMVAENISMRLKQLNYISLNIKKCLFHNLKRLFIYTIVKRLFGIFLKLHPVLIP